MLLSTSTALSRSWSWGKEHPGGTPAVAGPDPHFAILLGWLGLLWQRITRTHRLKSGTAYFRAQEKFSTTLKDLTAHNVIRADEGGGISLTVALCQELQKNCRLRQVGNVVQVLWACDSMLPCCSHSGTWSRLCRSMKSLA